MNLFWTGCESYPSCPSAEMGDRTPDSQCPRLYGVCPWTTAASFESVKNATSGAYRPPTMTWARLGIVTNTTCVRDDGRDGGPGLDHDDPLTYQVEHHVRQKCRGARSAAPAPTPLRAAVIASLLMARGADASRGRMRSASPYWLACPPLVALGRPGRSNQAACSYSPTTVAVSDHLPGVQPDSASAQWLDGRHGARPTAGPPVARDPNQISDVVHRVRLRAVNDRGVLSFFLENKNAHPCTLFRTASVAVADPSLSAGECQLLHVFTTGFPTSRMADWQA